LPQERHIIGLQGIGMIERAIHETVAYVKSRKAFGGTIWDFQNTQFKLAECKTEATVAKVFMANSVNTEGVYGCIAVCTRSLVLSSETRAWLRLKPCNMGHGA